MHSFPFKPAKQPRFLPGFSLIELLAVIGIMSILMVATIPVLSNTSSNARQASREIIKAHLQQARAHVIANDTRTKVLISVHGTRSETGSRPTAMFEVELEDCSFSGSVGTSATTVAARGQLDDSRFGSPSII